MGEPMDMDNALTLQDNPVKLDGEKFLDFEDLRSHVFQQYPNFKDKFDKQFRTHIP
jgi:hypothetical protein